MAKQPDTQLNEPPKVEGTPTPNKPPAVDQQERAPDPDAPRDERQKANEGVVARGHTVQNGDGIFGPGQTVKGDPKEIEKMRRRGVLVDSRRIIAPLGTGPQFFKEDDAAKGDQN